MLEVKKVIHASQQPILSLDFNAWKPSKWNSMGKKRMRNGIKRRTIIIITRNKNNKKQQQQQEEQKEQEKKKKIKEREKEKSE